MPETFFTVYKSMKTFRDRQKEKKSSDRYVMKSEVVRLQLCWLEKFVYVYRDFYSYCYI